ncbi:MAG: polyhydroxybutyrate depolymerase [Myxococcales bacterium]|nr:polyhydroxybutyrate depolymerase [Myxococcales bacterium]
MSRDQKTIMRVAGWMGVALGSLLCVGCSSHGAGGGSDATVPVGSGGMSSSGSGSGGTPMGSGGSGSGGASGMIDAGMVAGSGGAAADLAPVIDSGPASSDVAQGVCTGGTLKSGNSTLMIQSGGATRTYILHVPAKYDGKTRLPLVIDMHGKGDTAAHQVTWSGWREKADAVGIVVIYPQGIGNSWNGGPPGCPTLQCCCQPAQDQKIDDAGFIRAVVTKTAQDGCIDLKRVYATGLSNGGIMSQWLACDAADMFAAVAPVSGPNMIDCKPSRPISVVLYRGLMDSGVLYNGGASMAGGHVWPSAMADFAKWGDLDKCTDAPVPMPMHAVCQIRSKCAGDTEIVLCSPNAPHNLYGTAMSQMVGVADVAWEVLQRHTLP